MLGHTALVVCSWASGCIQKLPVSTCKPTWILSGQNGRSLLGSKAGILQCFPMEESNKLAIPSYMCLGSGQRSRWNISIPRMPLLLQKGVKMATASKENGIGHPQGCLQSSVPGMGSAHSAACECSGIASYRADNSHVFAKQPDGQAGHLAARAHWLLSCSRRWIYF